MQHGPGAENAFGGVAQAYGESVPIVVIPAGYPTKLIERRPELQLVPPMQRVAKLAEHTVTPAHGQRDDAARAFTGVAKRSAAPGLVEDAGRHLRSRGCPIRPPTCRRRGRARPRTPRDVAEAAEVLVAAERPVSTRARACTTPRRGTRSRSWPSCCEAPVTTSLAGKSAFPEDHPLSLGTGWSRDRQAGARVSRRR